MRLPRFDLEEYIATVALLVDAGYSARRLSDLRKPGHGRCLYLRHDIDFDPRFVTAMAQAESDAGLHATYYVMLTQHYNALEMENARVIRRLGDLGHDIGLHYDMRSYPSGVAEARRHLDWEVAVLAEIAQQAVTTIVMHHPSSGQTDPFLEVDSYLHPHDPRLQDGLIYISDSCRAWRDTGLMSAAAGDGSDRLVLNTHPELWLDGSEADRMEYLPFLRDAVCSHYRDFFDTFVHAAWTSHPGARLHDQRHERNDCTT